NITVDQFQFTPFTSPAQARARAHSVAPRLQYGTSALPDRLADAGRVRQHLHPATVARAVLNRWLRASSRRFTRPAEQSQSRKQNQNWILTRATSPCLPNGAGIESQYFPATMGTRFSDQVRRQRQAYTLSTDNS